MSAPEGESVPISEAEAIERTQALVEDGRTLQSLIYTGGDTDYAYIYLAFVTGEYRGNEMMWQRYVWLSKPGAYENDMWGDNGISMRMVDGMTEVLPAAIARACNGLKKDYSDKDPLYRDLDYDDDT